jgi:hypothetical protein
MDFSLCFYSLLVVSGMYERRDFNKLNIINYALLYFKALASFKHRWDKIGGLKGDIIKICVLEDKKLHLEFPSKISRLYLSNCISFLFA